MFIVDKFYEFLHLCYQDYRCLFKTVRDKLKISSELYFMFLVGLSRAAHVLFTLSRVEEKEVVGFFSLRMRVGEFCSFSLLVTKRGSSQKSNQDK